MQNSGQKFYRAITDDTMPGGPVERTIKYVAPFDRCDREQDYETLINLMERWEYEIVEFKEAKGQYSEDRIGQYFSAISNEASTIW